MPDTFDIAFLGGGPAGYQGAIRAAQLGAKAAVVEEKFLGGVCLNWGCIPTKTVRASAEAGRTLRRAKEFGFQPVEARPDLAAIIARKDRVVNALRGSIGRLFQANQIALIEGRGRLAATGGIELEENRQQTLVHANKVVVATGSRPAGLPMFPKHPRIFLADEALNLNFLPKHLLVVGGGSVGVEMAAIFRELGVEVTLVEALERLLPNEDAEMADYLQGVLKRRKVKILCAARITAVSEVNDQFKVVLADGTELNPDTIILAAGRKPNTDGLGLAELGIELNKRRITVNEHLQTNRPGLYAAGDVVGRWSLAHVAFAEGICAAEHALGRDSAMDYRVVPRCVFTIPEYAAVGVSEAEAQNHQPIKVARFPFKSLGMGQATGELEGLVKIIIHAQTDRILGAHIVGPHAAEMIAEIALAMRADLPSRVIMETIHSHPTFSEAVLEVAQALHGQAIHQAPATRAS
jgi:dihydrolipoamide dehydrogenase